MEVKSKWAAAVFIVMALVLALGMAVIAAPGDKEAEARVQEWSGMLAPSPLSRSIMPFEDVILLEVSPDYPADNTIYAVTLNVMPPVPTWNFVKSSGALGGGGYWWTVEGTGLPNAALLAMAVAPDDPDYVVVVSATTVYASNDGGATFTAIGAVPLAAGEAITSVDVSPLLSGIHQIMVGVWTVAAGVAAEGVYIWGWGTPPSLTWTPQGLDNGVFGIVDPARDVTSVAFSSNYLSDGVILAVGSDATDTYLHIRDVTNAQGTWNDNATFGYVAPEDPAGVLLEDATIPTVSPTEAQIVSSSLALPSDYDGTRATRRMAYVALDDAANPGTDDAYRVRNTTVWAMNAVVRISSLDYAGNMAGGALLAGLTALADVYVTTTPAAGTVMWASSSKAPTGTGTTLVAAPDDFPTSGIAFCATSGAPLDGSGLSKTYNKGDTWNQVGLIDTLMDGGITDIEPVDADTSFMTTACVEGEPLILLVTAATTVANTVTINYINQNGAAAVTPPVTVPAAAPPLTVIGPVALAAGDTGVTDVTAATSTALDAAATVSIIGAISMTVLGTHAFTAAPGTFTDSGLVTPAHADSLWISIPGGLAPQSLWERVDAVAMPGGAPDVEISPDYATDNTVYWADAVVGGPGTTLIRVSQDGGAYFATRTSPTAISDFVVADANTIYYVDAATAAVYKSSDTGRTWPTTGVLAAPGNIIEISPEADVLAASGSTIVSICVDLTAHPLSFLPVSMIGTAAALQYIAFSDNYSADATMYVADSAGGVWKAAAGTDTQIDLTAALANTVAAPSGISCIDGTLYVADATAGNGVWRTMNPTETPVIPGMEPQWVNLSWGVPAAATFAMVETIGGSNVLYGIDTATAMIPGAITTTLMEFTDTLVGTVVTLVSPANGAITGVVEAIPVGTPRVRVDFEWSAAPDAHQYRIQVDTDAGFHNPVINLQVTAPDVTLQVVNLLTDMEYNWRVRVEQFITTAGASPWSASWSFTTPVGTAAIAPEILGPENGQQNVGVEDPCFTWGSVTGATEYKFTLKDSAGTVLVDTTATETSYCYAGELEYETSYVWTVQGTSATTESGVASATFSTEAEAEPTPAWVWIIIAIGAVVAIVVIVLIVRTRRPV